MRTKIFPLIIVLFFITLNGCSSVKLMQMPGVKITTSGFNIRGSSFTVINATKLELRGIANGQDKGTTKPGGSWKVEFKTSGLMGNQSQSLSFVVMDIKNPEASVVKNFRITSYARNVTWLVKQNNGNFLRFTQN